MVPLAPQASSVALAASDFGGAPPPISPRLRSPPDADAVTRASDSQIGTVDASRRPPRRKSTIADDEDIATGGSQPAPRSGRFRIRRSCRHLGYRTVFVSLEEIE